MSDRSKVPTASLADAEPLPEEELHSRRVSLAQVAEKRHPGAGWTVHQWWREMNEELFGRQMKPSRIRFEEISGQRPSGQCRFGSWKREGNTILLDCSLLHQHGNVWRLYHEELGRRLAYDALLHQMTHQYIDTARNEAAGQKEEPFPLAHDTHEWIAEINRLGKALGLEKQAALGIPASTKADATVGLLVGGETAYWPYLARDTDYYQTDAREGIGEFR